MSDKTAARILIVDDEESVRSYIERRLRKLGYYCNSCKDGFSAIDLARGDGFDLVITDVNMPGMNGVELLRRLRGLDETVSVIMVTAVIDISTAITALRDGAYDYITKPIESERLLSSVERAIEKTRLVRENIEYQNNLERMVRERTAEVEEKSRRLRKFFVETTMALAGAIEAKDKYTEGHSRRVAQYSRRLAVKLGLESAEAELIYVAGSLHDIGKIGVPDKVLHKPGVFNDEERKIMQKHPVMSADILARIEDFADIREIVLHHHERYDGGGYPSGLKGEDIPLGARILAAADAFDAMTSERPYRPAMSRQRALGEIEKGKGAQFDPRVADEFAAMAGAGELEMEDE